MADRSHLTTNLAAVCEQCGRKRWVGTDCDCPPQPEEPAMTTPDQPRDRYARGGLIIPAWERELLDAEQQRFDEAEAEKAKTRVPFQFEVMIDAGPIVLSGAIDPLKLTRASARFFYGLVDAMREVNGAPIGWPARFGRRSAPPKNAASDERNSDDDT